MTGIESKPSVLVLGGGPDAERPVSIESAAAVASSLAKAGHEVRAVTIDRPSASELAAMQGEVVFPALHGSWGEGGGLQQLLERDGRPFVGSGESAARLAMDKLATKLVAAKLGLPTPCACVVRPGDTGCSLQAPAVIKPVFEGSSVGLFVCQDDESIAHALVSLDSQYSPWLAEAMIAGRELTVGVLASDGGGLTALPIVEIRPKGGVYDYNAKYQRDDTQYVVDPELPIGIAAILGEHAVRVAQAIGVRHLARVDFMLDGDGVGWLLEVNTMPGFTSHSLFPMAAAGAGLDMPALTSRLVLAAAMSETRTKQGV